MLTPRAACSSLVVIIALAGCRAAAPEIRPEEFTCGEHHGSKQPTIMPGPNAILYGYGTAAPRAGTNHAPPARKVAGPSQAEQADFEETFE